MPATPEEMKTLLEAFEATNPPVARALADLLARGKVILEEHRLLLGPLGEDFEALVFKLAEDHAVSRRALANAMAELERIRVTVDELDTLP